MTIQEWINGQYEKARDLYIKAEEHLKLDPSSEISREEISYAEGVLHTLEDLRNFLTH